MKVKCIITNQKDYSNLKEESVLRFSNAQWVANPERLEGYEFSDVIVKCNPNKSLRDWLHMHLGIRIDRIIYAG
jgi:hypothetical protein